ncbi:MAG: alpha-amylase family glycosyl hydrolase [Anaerolineaceae bacterium]
MNMTTEKPDWLDQVLHFGTSDYLSNPRPRLGERVRVRLRAPMDAPILQVVLRTIPNGEQQFTAMTPSAAQGGWRDWEAELRVNEPRVPYRFAIRTESVVWWLNAAGSGQGVPFSLFDFKLLADTPAIPWLAGSVFYQIFPDRFENGDPANDPINEPIPYRDWRRQSFPWGQSAPREPGLLPFYGGDLAGIQQKLDYLERLGVNALYLNPIFSAYTNHRYDVTDYEHVDPVLGGDPALQSLSEALRERGMRYILDIVPNHCGIGHPWFQAAKKDPNSPEREYFFFGEVPGDYVSWLGFGSLPKLNYASQRLRDLMYRGEDGIMRRWLRAPWNASGWRVDVGNMLGRQDAQQLDREILPEIRAAVKETNPEAYLVAENFFEAASQLQGEGWDGVMNYSGFTDPLLHWLRPYQQDAVHWEGKLGGSERWPTGLVLRAWQENLAAVPWALALQQLNLIDSHDTARILSELGGNKRLSKLAAAVQFCFPGVPCLYYGDEIGLTDLEGFGSRACMEWDESAWDLELFGFYQQLIALRKSSRALAEGAFQILFGDAHSLLFQRVLGNERVLVYANRSEEAAPARELALPQAGFADQEVFRGLLGGGRAAAERGVLRLPALEQGAEIWLMER